MCHYYAFAALAKSTNKKLPKIKTADLLTKLVDRRWRLAGLRLQVEDSEIIANVNFIDVTNHPESPLGIKVTVPWAEPKHTCLYADQSPYTYSMSTCPQINDISRD